jgi:hypothetical protein
VTINQKTISYTELVSDTDASAAAALQQLLSSSGAPAEFQEITWTVASNVITGTAATAGSPFTASVSSSGGATLTQAHVVVNSSPSDVANPNNWSGATLPTTGDAVVFQASAVPALWNLTQFSGVAFASITVYMSYVGQIGLPEYNANGYLEYRSLYLQHAAGLVTIGIGSGQGAGLLQFDAQTTATVWNVANAGTPTAGTYSVQLLNTNVFSVLEVSGGVVGVAMNPGESATFASATIQGGSLDLGPTVGCPTVMCNGAAVNLRCPVGSVTMNGGTATLASNTGYGSLTTNSSAQVSWAASGGIGILNLTGASVLRADGSPLAKYITQSVVSSDSTVYDPNNTIVYSSPTQIVGAVRQGVFVFGPGRNVQLI